MSNGYDGSIKIDTQFDDKKFIQGANSVSRSLKNLFGILGKIGVAIGLAFGIGQIVNFGKSAVQAASDLSSAMVGLQSILNAQGKSFADAQGFIQDYVKDGLLPAADAITAYKNLAATGFSNPQIEQLLISLKDAAAFGRQGSLSLGEAVKSATEGIKNENSVLVDNAGVTKNLSKIWEEYAASIGKTVDNLSQAEKNEATLNGIMKETQYQVGDAAKLAGTYAGQVLGLTGAFQRFKEGLGNVFIPILQKVIPYIKNVVDWMVYLAEMAAKFVSVLFGADSSATVQGYQTDMQSIANSGQAAADAQGDLAKNTTKAGKAAKGALAAFDDLNVLQMDNGQGTGGGVDLGIETQAKETGSLIDTIDEKFRSFVERIKLVFLELVAPLQEPFEKVKEALSNLGATAWENLKWAYENILEPLGLWLLQDAAPVFLDLLAAGLDLLNEVLIKASPKLKWLWENILLPFATWSGEKILDFFTWFADSIRKVAKVWEEQGFVAAVIAGMILMVKRIKENFYEMLGGILSASLQASTWVLQHIIEPIKSWFIGLWDKVKTLASEAWAGVKNIWNIAGEWFRNTIIEPIKNGFKTGLDFIKTQWENTFTGIKTFVKNTINSIIDFINGMIFAVAGGINAVINGLNKINVTIPSWVPGYGGDTWGLSIPNVAAPSIPRLATGAVIPPNSEFMAILGDQKSGRNIETPEALLRQIVREELGNIQADISIGFTGSLGALVRELKPKIDKENVRIGGSLVQGGASI